MFHGRLGVKFVKKVASIFDSTNNLLAVFSGILIIYIMLSVSMEVTLRSLGHPTIWVVEIATYSLLFMTFLGTAWLLRHEGHVRMDIVLSRFSPGTQTIINIITSSLGTIACLIITWYGVQVAWEHFQKGWVITSLLEPPAYPILAVIPLGTFLLFIQFIRRTYGYLREQRSAGQGKNKGTEVTVV